MVSNKFGEDEFNLNDIMDVNDSESDQDEILRKFKTKTTIPHHKPAMSVDHSSLGTKK
jgi:hypothetical protein